GRPDAPGRRLGRQGGARPPSARRRTHRRPPQGRRGGLRPRQGDEGGLASGRQRCDRQRLPDRQPLRQTMDDRAGVPRHQGFAFRHGPERPAHRRSATARPSAAAQRLGDPPPDAARRGRRKPRHGSIAQNQHGQTPRPFAVPPGLPALRSHPQHARATLKAARRKIRRLPKSKQRLHTNLRPRLNEGMREVVHNKYLLTFAELGVIGLILFLLFLLALVWFPFAKLQWKSPFQYALTLGLSGSVVGQIVFYMFDHFSYDIRLSMLYVTAGLLVASRAAAIPTASAIGQKNETSRKRCDLRVCPRTSRGIA